MSVLTFDHVTSSQLVVDDLTIDNGQWIGIESLTTDERQEFLSLTMGLHRPTHGTVQLLQTDLSDLEPDDAARFRAEHIGIVFPGLNLVPHLSLRENVLYAARLTDSATAQQRTEQLLEAVGLSDQRHARPESLRDEQLFPAAIARATVNEPELLVINCPTIELDDYPSVTELIRSCAVISAAPTRLTDQQLAVVDGHLVQPTTPEH